MVVPAISGCHLAVLSSVPQLALCASSVLPKDGSRLPCVLLLLLLLLLQVLLLGQVESWHPLHCGCAGPTAASA